MSKNDWKYFKIGDIVKDSRDSIWGETRFVVVSLLGNWYCPILYSHIVGKFYPSGKPQECNLDARTARLINADKRPFKKVPKKVLLKIMNKGNLDAKREFMIRLNIKTL